MLNLPYLKKLRPKHTVLILVFLQFNQYVAICQDNLNTLATSFNQYQQNNLGEKIFAHTDKNFYIAGEIVWFKLYAVDASSYKPLDLSKVAYAEILDTANKPLLQAKIAMNSGDGNGSFYLPLTLNSGNYKLRAYTNWMKNFGADYFFEKTITIINTQKILAIPNTASTHSYDLQFFPEGGNLVNNIESKVAFKAVDQNGKGINFTGLIIDNTDTLLKFGPLHAGMGNFSFRPLSNHSYKAYIKTADGQTIIKDLPTIYASGYVMNVTSTDDKIKVNVQSSSNTDEVYLFVHTGASVKVAEKGIIQNGNTIFTFSKSILDNGVSHITVFNSLKQPVCERLYFKKPVSDLDITLNTDQPSYKTRKKVNINISSQNVNSTNDSASLSMAVYLLDSLQTLDGNTINTYLQLTSELKGYIEDPQYYFTATDSERETALDNLMLTNGWRRFKWSNILQNTRPLFSFVPEYNGHIVKGKVINIKNRNTEKYIETFLSVPGTRTQFSTSISDDSGNIKFEIKNFYGSSKIILQTNSQRDSSYAINIDDPFSNLYSSTTIPAFRLPEKYPNTLLDHSISMQVQNIYESNKLKQLIFPSIDTTAFYLNPDAKYLLDDYTRFTTLEEILREYVSLVNLTKRNGRYHMQVFDNGNNNMFSDDPLVLIDGVPVFDFNKFLNYDPLKLKSLEVVNKKYILGGSNFTGILNWKTYNGDLADFKLDPRAAVIDYEGLQLEREFYTPNYSNAEEYSTHLPDFRNVLYWAPKIKLNNHEKKQVSFYTSDLPGRYAIVVQGISTNGLCGSNIITFEVKK